MKPANIARERGRRTGTENGERGLVRAPAEKTPTPAHDFLAWFVDEYKAKRHGAKYRVTAKHGGIVKGLLQTHPPDRLQRLTLVLFGSNDQWIESTDRGIEVLAAKLNWLEERLAAWETQRHARDAV